MSWRNVLSSIRAQLMDTRQFYIELRTHELTHRDETSSSRLTPPLSFQFNSRPIPCFILWILNPPKRFIVTTIRSPNRGGRYRKPFSHTARNCRINEHFLVYLRPGSLPKYLRSFLGCMQAQKLRSG